MADDGYTIPRFEYNSNTATPVSQSTLNKAIPAELLVTCHVLNLPTSQIEQYVSRSKQPNPKWTGPEAETLLKAVAAQMSLYPTTIAQDAEVLASLKNNGLLSSHRRLAMAVQVRMGEKEILLQLRELLTSFLAQLGKNAPLQTTAGKRGHGETAPDGAEKRRKN